MLVELSSLEESARSPDQLFRQTLEEGSRRSPLGGLLTEKLILGGPSFQMVGNASANAIMNLMGHEERAFAFFDLKLQIHANVPASNLAEEVFFYEFGRSAFQSLSRLSWTGPPHSRVLDVFPMIEGRSLREGSIMLDISLGAATVAGSVMAYPKFSLGVKAMLSDIDNLRKWSLRALEKRRVFKNLNGSKE